MPPITEAKDCKTCSKTCNPFSRNHFVCPGCLSNFHIDCVKGLKNASKLTKDCLLTCINLLPFCDACTNAWTTFGEIPSAQSDSGDMAKLSAQVTTMASDLSELKDALSEKKNVKDLGPAEGKKEELESVVKKAVSSALSESTIKKEEESKRVRSIVIDGLPEQKSHILDLNRVKDLVGFLGGQEKINVLDVHRMGKERPEGSRPRKVKVLLGSEAQQEFLLTKTTRSCLKSSDGMKLWPDIFISPLRTTAENNLLFLLRTRRYQLNMVVGPPGTPGLDKTDRGNSWYVDSVRYTIGKLTNGKVDRKARPEDYGEMSTEEWLKYCGPDFLAQPLLT